MSLKSRVIFGLAALAFVSSAAGQVIDPGPPTLTWIRQFGTPATDSALAVAVDAAAVYVGGTINGGTGGLGYVGPMFLRRYDVAGNLLWNQEFGTGIPYDAQELKAIALHSTGVYVAGYMSAPNLPAVNPYAEHAFVRKHDANGRLLWMRQFGGLRWEQIHALACDRTGVYLGGYSRSELEPGAIGLLLVRKYSHDGVLLWTRQFGFGDFEMVRGIAADETGVYLAAFTTTPGSTLLVRKYDPFGNELWTNGFGNGYADHLSSAALDDSGLYVAGATDGVLGDRSYGGRDAFVRKYSLSGVVLWTEQFGTPSDDFATGVATDGHQIYVAGRTTTATEPSDIFVRSFTVPSRDMIPEFHVPAHVWSTHLGTPTFDTVAAIAANRTGLYVAGGTRGSLGGPNAGLEDAFVLKMNHTPAFIVQRLKAMVQADVAAHHQKSLLSKLENIEKMLERGPSNPAACNVAKAFEAELEAQSKPVFWGVEDILYFVNLLKAGLGCWN